MVLVDGQGISLACYLDAANKAEVTLLDQALDNVVVAPAGRGDPPPRPRRLICDPGYDIDSLRERLLFERDIEVACPHRRNRVRPRLQDGRKLRRYRRRLMVERTFAWLGNFRRLVVSYERSLKMYRACFHVACVLITLRQL
jgi:transposase